MAITADHTNCGKNLYCTDSLLDYLYTQTLSTQPVPDTSPSVFSEWKKKKKEEVRSLLRIDELDSLLCVPVSAEKVDHFIADGITVEKYTMQGIRHLNTPLYIAGTDHPASKSILYLHGHDKYGIQGALKHLETTPYHKWLPLLLAKAGYRVYAPEMIGFGEAVKENYDMGASTEGSCFPNGTQLLACGFSLAGLRAFQTSKVIDLMKLQNVEDISVFGISGGGMGAMYLGVCDDRINRMILSGYPCTWPATLFVHHHCIDNFVPGMTRVADDPEIISLFAPKPLLLMSGSSDHVFASEGVKKAFATVAQAYHAVNASGQLLEIIFEGGHEVSPEPVLNWLKGQNA